MMHRPSSLPHLLVLLLLLPTLVSAGDTPVYRWQREIEVPGIAETTLVGVPLDSHFFHATRDGWPDVRLRNERDEPVAFVIRAAHDLKTRSVRQTWQAQQLSAKVDATVGLQVEFVLREKEPVPNGIRIMTPLRDFEHQVRVESSADGTTWNPISRPTVIFDYSRFVDARNDLVPLDSSNHRRFRLTIEDLTAEQESLLLELHKRLRGSDEIDRTESTTITRRPFRVDRIEFYHDDVKIENNRPQSTTYPTEKFLMTEREKEHQTVVAFDTQREPITDIKLITTAENFSRLASVEFEVEDANGSPVWQPVSHGTVARFSVGTIQREELTLIIRESHAIHYRVVIENRDSPPLSITGVELTGPLYELTYLAGPNEKLTLEYGSSNAKAGHYDTAALKEALSQGQSPVPARMKPANQNENAPEPVQVWQPWNDTRVLFGAIVAVTLFLGWGLVRAGRRIETPK